MLIDSFGIMVKTPPYQKRGKCGHFMSQFDSHLACFGCRSKCKEQEPCAQGAKVNQCATCSTLSDQQWTHLRESFAKRSSYRHRTGSHEPETDEEPVFTGEDLGQVDNTLLDLEPEQTSNMAPVTGISPLTQPSSASLPATSFPANTGLVQQSSVASPALFRAPDPVLTQDTISTGQTPSRRGDRTYFPTFSMPQPQRTATPIDIPQTPRTQLLKSHLEQQNFELMHKLQRKKNEEQISQLNSRQVSKPFYSNPWRACLTIWLLHKPILLLKLLLHNRTLFLLHLCLRSQLLTNQRNPWMRLQLKQHRLLRRD